MTGDNGMWPRLLFFSALLALLPAFARAGALEDHGIVLVGPATEAVRDELEAGLLALPENARTPPGGPLEVELHPEASRFGMGDGEARREWSDGHRRFHLYAFNGESEPRAAARLSKLSDGERERLWRRRAMVHAVVIRWNDQLRASERDGWRRITGWEAPLDRPLTWTEHPANTYDWAYSRLRGKEGAALDLATFAEEALVPAESIHADAVPADEQVRCQEFSKSRFLWRMLGAVGPREKRSAAPSRGKCPIFDAFADPEHLDHIEILFASPSGKHPESVFGHVLLRPVKKSGEVVSGRSFEPVVEIAALTSPAENKVEFAVKGTIGRFQTIFSLSSLANILKQNLEIDQRNLKRFKLELSAEEAQRVLERSWELERRGYFDYYFFTDNCATFLVYLLNGSFDEEKHIKVPGTLWVMPSATLDAIEKVRTEENGVEKPLLSFIPEIYESSRDIADRAESRRIDEERDLEALLAPGAAASWAQTYAKIHDPDPRVRQTGYEALPARVAEALAAGPRERARTLVYAFLQDTLKVERYAVDLAQVSWDEVDRKAIKIPKDLKIPSTPELLEERQKQYQHEDPEGRMLHDLERYFKYQNLLKTLPRRPFSESEQKKLADAEAVKAAFARLTAIEADLVDAHFEDVDPEAWAEGERRERVTREAAAEPLTLTTSGYARTAYGAVAAWSPSGGFEPMLEWRSAVLSEDFGDQRQRGFGSQSEIHLGDGVYVFRPRLGAYYLPDLVKSDIRVIEFATLAREPLTLRRGLFDGVGYGAGVDYFYRPGRELEHHSLAHLEVMTALYGSGRFESVTAIGAGAAGEVANIGFALGGIAVAPRAVVKHRTHLGGLYANALRVEAVYMPKYGLYGPERFAFRHVLEASATLDWQVGGRGKWAFLIGPRLYAGLDYLGASRESWVRLALSIELL